jgi:hypothetical protein
VQYILPSYWQLQAVPWQVAVHVLPLPSLHDAKELPPLDPLDPPEPEHVVGAPGAGSGIPWHPGGGG